MGNTNESRPRPRAMSVAVPQSSPFSEDQISFRLECKLKLKSLQRKKKQAQKQILKQMSVAKRCITKGQQDEAKMHLQMAANHFEMQHKLQGMILNAEKMQMDTQQVKSSKAIFEIYSNALKEADSYGLNVMKMVKDKEAIEKNIQKITIDGKLLQQMFKNQQMSFTTDVNKVFDALKEQIHLEQVNKLGMIVPSQNPFENNKA